MVEYFGYWETEEKGGGDVRPYLQLGFSKTWKTRRIRLLFFLGLAYVDAFMVKS